MCVYNSYFIYANIHIYAYLKAHAPLPPALNNSKQSELGPSFGHFGELLRPSWDLWKIGSCLRWRKAALRRKRQDWKCGSGEEFGRLLRPSWGLLAVTWGLVDLLKRRQAA